MERSWWRRLGRNHYFRIGTQVRLRRCGRPWLRPAARLGPAFTCCVPTGVAVRDAAVLPAACEAGLQRIEPRTPPIPDPCRWARARAS